MALRETLKKWTEGPWLYVTSWAFGVLESSFVFVPVEPLLIPIMAGRGNRIWIIAACLLAGNIVGAAIMYALGAGLAANAVEPVVTYLGGASAYQNALADLQERGILALLLIDLTPIPFQVAMAAAGAAHFALAPFFAAVILSRGVRYFGLAALLRLLGPRAERWIADHQTELFIVGMAAFVLLSVIVFVL